MAKTSFPSATSSATGTGSGKTKKPADAQKKQADAHKAQWARFNRVLQYQSKDWPPTHVNLDASGARLCSLLEVFIMIYLLVFLRKCNSCTAILSERSSLRLIYLYIHRSNNSSCRDIPAKSLIIHSVWFQFLHTSGPSSGRAGRTIPPFSLLRCASRGCYLNPICSLL